MAISITNALGVHEQGLLLRSRRAEILSNNLANADTPNFKAKDIDFKSALRAASAGQSSGPVQLQQTHDGHLSLPGSAATDVKYRNPTQPSIDGNTVDSQVEVAEFSANAVEFQAAFQFLNSKFRGLTSAIRGE